MQAFLDCPETLRYNSNPSSFLHHLLLACRGFSDGGTRGQGAKGGSLSACGWLLQGAFYLDTKGQFSWVTLAYGCRFLGPGFASCEARLFGTEALLQCVNTFLGINIKVGDASTINLYNI